MDRLKLVCFVLCFCLIKIQGSEVIHRFVKTGSDITLDITDPAASKDYAFLQWRFNIKNPLVTVSKDQNPTFKSDRVEFHPKNSSLTLKKLQKKHSGLYEAALTRNSEGPITFSYNITVQDPVSPVLLSVVSKSFSSDSCNFTVSCRPESSSISHSFTCGRLTCDPTPFDHTLPLQLYLSNTSVICNHSNHVSWINVTKGIEEVCSDQDKGKINDGLSGAMIGVISVSCVAAVLAVGAIFVVRKRRRNQRIMVDNTVYEVPQVSSPRAVPDSDLRTSAERPDTIYSEVQPHSAPPPASVQNPESLYATVNKTQPPDLLTSAT